MAERNIDQVLDDLIAAHKKLKAAHDGDLAHGHGSLTDDERAVHSVQLRIHIEKLREFRKQLKVERLDAPRRRKEQ